MKLGYRTSGLGDRSWKRCFSILNEIGYEMVEICLEDSEVLEDKGPEADTVKEWLQQNDLEASISYHGDNVSLSRKIKNTYKAIEFAGDLGVNTVIINAESVKPGKKEQQLEKISDRFQNFCKEAKKEGVTLAVEPEPDLVIHGLKDTLKLLKEVNSPQLGVNLDIGHVFITDGDLPEVINKLEDAIVYTHLEDISGKVHKHLLPGAGDIDFEELITSLKNINYDGPLVFDLFGLGNNHIEYAKQAYSYLEEIR